MRELAAIFISFCKVGVLTFGGGYAMLPILRREIAQRRGWITDEEAADYFAMGQCLPGIIAVNTAVFVGRGRKGVPGGIAAAFGVIFPSFVIILIIASLLQNFAHIPQVQSAFYGIRIAVAALILDAVIKMWKSGIKDLFGIFIFVTAFILSVVLNISPVILVLCAILVGNIWMRTRRRET